MFGKPRCLVTTVDVSVIGRLLHRRPWVTPVTPLDGVARQIDRVGVDFRASHAFQWAPRGIR